MPEVKCGLWYCSANHHGWCSSTKHIRLDDSGTCNRGIDSTGIFRLTEEEIKENERRLNLPPR